MLSVFDSGQKYPIIGYSDFYITHISGGEDTLNFTVPINSEIYTHLAEENRIEYGDNYYLIKSIDAPSRYANIACTVDLDFLRDRFYKAYDSGSLPLSELLNSLLPIGWTLQGYLPAIRRTIRMENATPYDILERAKSTYSVAYEWHTLSKILKVVNPEVTTPSGEYLTDELNLRKIAFKGKSSDLITRLYPYGKDGLSIASINGGKEYVENHQYTGKTVAGIWKDDRYTDALSLKTDAEIMLSQLSMPARSYDCDVVDLAKLDSRYSDFSFSMYKVVTLIDRIRHVRMNHKIMEYREYPDEPQKNILTLSSVIKDIKKQLDSAISSLQADVDTANRNVSLNQDISNKVTGLIANAFGFFTTNEVAPDGATTAYMHNKPLLSESSIVWKMTSGGFVWSTDGGASWNAGISADGNATLKTLSAVGIVADWLIAGIIKSRDGSSSWNLDTGEMDLNGTFKSKGELGSGSGVIPVYAKMNGANLSFYVDNGTQFGDVHGTIGLGNFRGDDGVNINGKKWVTIGASGTFPYSCTVTTDTYANRFRGNLLLEQNARMYMTNGAYISPASSADSFYFGGNGYFSGNLSCGGTKNRVVKTDYGAVGMNAFETMGAYFADFGSGTIGEDGKCYIWLDPVFLQTIDPHQQYQVFLTPTSEGSYTHIAKAQDYFIVYGDVGLKFDWQIVCKQRGYQNDRAERVDIDTDKQIDYDMSIFNQEQEIERAAENYLENYYKELIYD